MNERDILYKICNQAEKKFDVICYAYKDGLFWNICINDYDKYRSNEFKNFSSYWYNKIKDYKFNSRIVFCYCCPNEQKWIDLFNKDNLIFVI